jgi:hypothetical protein
MANHLGEDCAGPAPGSKNLLLTAFVHDLNLLEQFWGNERPLFQ